MSQGNGKGRIM